jgi:hypothetical protein
MNGNFTNKTFFYNVAKALNNILREILMQENITPQAFLNHIKLLQQPGDNSTIGLQNSLLFMTEVENTLRNILDVNHTYDPEILINEKAYPLYIWAMAINVDDSDEQLRPILLSNTSESGPIEPAPPELQAP